MITTVRDSLGAEEYERRNCVEHGEQYPVYHPVHLLTVEALAIFCFEHAQFGFVI